MTQLCGEIIQFFVKKFFVGSRLSSGVVLKIFFKKSGKSVKRLGKNLVGLNKKPIDSLALKHFLLEFKNQPAFACSCLSENKNDAGFQVGNQRRGKAQQFFKFLLAPHQSPAKISLKRIFPFTCQYVG